MQKLYLSFFLLLAGTLLSSCLKEKYTIPIDDNTDRLLTEFTTARQPGNAIALDFSTQFVDVDLTELRILPRSAMSQSVQVKIAVNNALVSGAGYSILPAVAYSVLAYDYTLTPTERKTKVRLRVQPSALVGGSYAIGLSIQEVSEGEIAQEAKDIVIEVKVKNDYEGDYYASGLRLLYAGATAGSGVVNQFEIDTDKYLYTIDQNTVETDVADLVGGAWMFLEIDPATYEVTVMPSTISPTFLLSNDGPCTYDPATRTFTLHYKYFNASGALRRITETITAY